MRVLGPWTSVLGCPGLGQFPCRVVIILMTVRRSRNAPYNLRLVKLDVHVCGARKYARICWRTYLYGRPIKQKACVWAHEAFKMKRWDSQRPAFLGNATARIPRGICKWAGTSSSGIRLTTYNTISSCQAVPLSPPGRQKIQRGCYNNQRINKLAGIKGQDRNTKLRFDSCQVQMNLFRTVNCRSPRAWNFISIKSHQTIALIEDKQTARSLGYPVPSVSHQVWALFADPHNQWVVK